MRFTIQREAFLKPLRMVTSIVERRHSPLAPVLSNVLIKIQNSQTPSLFLTTTDQEIELVASGRLEESALAGAVTVSARKLMDICRALKEGDNLSFVAEENRLILRAGRSRFTLSTLPAEDFPALNEAITGLQFSVSKKTLRALLEQTGFAMAEQDVRHYLNGMLLEVKKDEVRCVAADGHRLALGTLEAPLKETEPLRVIVPRKGVLELQRILDEGDAEIKIILSSNHIRVIAPEVQLTSKLLEGRFPDYERIIPAGGDKVVIGNRAILKDAFVRAAALFTDRFRGVRLKLSSGCLKILATNAEKDEVEEDVEVDYSGSDLEIGFNVKYLIDLLNVMQSETVKFTFSDPNAGARVEGVGSEEGVHVIMPMRI